MLKQSKAYKAVIKARTMLLVSNPFFGCLALHLNLIEVKEDDPQITTMAVDGVNMYYNPKFVLGLSEPELVGVCAHEVMHCAWKHFARRQQRHPMIWNMAGDYVINADLKKANFTLPGKPVSHLNQTDLKEKGHLFEPKFDGMSTEEVYERIWQKCEKIVIKISGDGEGLDIGGCGAVLDAGSRGDKDGEGKGQQPGQAEADKIARDWETNVRMAVNIAKTSNAGRVPGYLERLAKQLEKPKVNWRDYTRNFIDDSMQKDYSWSRPNRRHVAKGLYLPGYIPDAMHHLVGCMDVSGSIPPKMINAMGGEFAGALDDGIADKLTIIYVDTEVKRVDEFQQGELVTIQTPGGGGTDFTSCMQYIRDKIPDASCVIFLTDMLTSSFGEEPECPVLWGAYLPEAALAGIQVPFGEVVHVDGSM